LKIIGPFLAVVLPVYVLSLAIGYGQAGFRITPKAVAFDLNKLNPIKGAQKILGPRGWVRTGLASLKIALISTAVVAMLYVQRDQLVVLVGLEVSTVLSRAIRILGKAALAGIAAALLLALIDLIYQRFQHGKDLRMSKKELKDEAKNTEGDPQVRARIRSVQREMARRRMMDDVPKATVVVTNPTHYAVALKYEEGQADRAPVVVAKGLDEVAQNIKRIAREAGVPIVEDKPLARGLHRMVDIGDEIPEELFEAVAKVLAFVLHPERNRETVGGNVS
jgi:flagellar biosynthetic protein FlhB